MRKSLIITRVALGISILTNGIMWQTNQILKEALQVQSSLDLRKIQDSAIHMI